MRAHRAQHEIHGKSWNERHDQMKDLSWDQLTMTQNEQIVNLVF